MNPTLEGLMDIATEIRVEATRRGTTLGALAANAGMTRQTLSTKLNGHTDFTLTDLRAIASALGTTAGTLLTRAETARCLSSTQPLSAPAGPVVGGSSAAPSSVERLLEHEQACDSCWSLEDAARHTAGAADETDPVAARPAALAAATGQEVA